MLRTTRHPAPSDTSQHWPATWAATCPGTRSPSSSSSPRRALYDRSQILEEGKLVCRNCSCQKSQEQLMFQDLRIWRARAFLLDAILPFVLKKVPSRSALLTKERYNTISIFLPISYICYVHFDHRIKDDRMEKPLKGRRFMHNLL